MFGVRPYPQSVSIILALFCLFLLIKSVNSYGCDCSCCTGSGCSLSYLGTISVSTCASTTCTDACKSKYSTCSTGSSSAVCSATNIFQFYSTSFIIISTIIFILVFKN
ncbi:unnamed protein product [Rotaria magnacalcarata]|uniref:Uncharacterized protein n=1 Tax=Rotaria magnacalcarata TaxID=392030 RepID=A0A819R5T5_9BILA|nr:unnamed protein product [Rotaria magnacalcarata]CAF1643272.1 unnamed protein product [Rotaria magnacalcarata]CAF2140367.1 unnamed protein product [Rotaria magnacalcarata]CAF2143647.1 unnamed protein product [Rotaria magnacalcarata]CAF2244174.1 unnamed protein product [Rotaria magnacalcarata]